MKFRTLFLLGLVFSSAFPPLKAAAAESLRYDQSPSAHIQKTLDLYITKNFGIAAKERALALVDLNADGINEYIVHERACLSQRSNCFFYILAEKDTGSPSPTLILLGTLQGKTILLGNDFLHGVRNLLAFGNEINDYDARLYVWVPQSASYERMADAPKTKS